ncbi:MAG: M24 family metallopeptidase [Thermodesulfobacteriota bacterium]
MHESHRPPPGEIQRRICGLQREMVSRGIHGVLITQRIDLLYFSGCAQNAYLYVPQKDGPILLVRKHLPRAALDSPLPLLTSLDSIRDIPRLVVEHGHPIPRVLGTAWDALPVREFNFFRGLFRSHAHVDVTDMVLGLRSIKSPWEIERISHSSRLCEMTLQHLEACIRPGTTETRIAGLSEAFARRHGHGGGIRVRLPSEDDRSGWLADDRGVVPDKGPFTVGFRSVVNGYHAATARIYGRESGPGSDRRAADSLEAFHESILSKAAGCTSLEELAAAACGTAKRTKYGDPAMGCNQALQGIGLELREPVEQTTVTGKLRKGGACIVLESRTRTLKGRALCIQDTLIMDSRGIRLALLPIETPPFF